MNIHMEHRHCRQQLNMVGHNAITLNNTFEKILQVKKTGTILAKMGEAENSGELLVGIFLIH